MRVVVVEDHPVTRVGIVALLGQDDRITVVGEAADGEGGLEVAAREDPDVVVTDLRLGDGLDGVGLTRALRSGRGAPEVLVLTTYDTDRDIVRAVEAGASGYLLKDAPPEELVAAVRSTARGDATMSPVVRDRLETRERTPRSSLTPRELEVLQLVAAGSSNREIGRQLMLSEATVKSHLVHIYDKLGVRSRTSAVASAREQGVL